MTAEDEEFNRIEMESRIKQEYIRAMRKTTREEKISRPAVYEVPANNRMIASHQDHVRRLMEELAIARVCIRELGDRLAKLEKTEPVACAECGANGGHALYCVRCAEKFVGGYKESVPVHTSELLTQVSTDTQYAGNGTAGIQNETKPTGFFFQMPPQRTWVGLTNAEIEDCFDDEHLVHARNIERLLKEKNT